MDIGKPTSTDDGLAPQNQQPLKTIPQTDQSINTGSEMKKQPDSSYDLPISNPTNQKPPENIGEKKSIPDNQSIPATKAPAQNREEPPPAPIEPEPTQPEPTHGVGTPNIGIEDNQIGQTPTAQSVTPEPTAPEPVSPPSPREQPPPQPAPPESPSPQVAPSPTANSPEPAVFSDASAEPPDNSLPTVKNTYPEKSQEDKIEISSYNNGSDTPPENPEAPADQPPEPQPIKINNYQSPDAQTSPLPQPPIKAPPSSASLIVTIIMVILVGGGIGFFGFRYWDNLKIAADAEITPAVTETETPSLNLDSWKIYNSTAYNFSLKYPNGWHISTTDQEAESIILASDEESLESKPTGYKITINFQNSNGQSLKNWVDANSIAANETKKVKEITVSEQTAYQQELTQNGPSVATYIERPSKIMVVTYSAPEEMFGDGGEWYNKLINSIKLI